MLSLIQIKLGRHSYKSLRWKMKKISQREFRKNKNMYRNFEHKKKKHVAKEEEYEVQIIE